MSLNFYNYPIAPLPRESFPPLPRESFRVAYYKNQKNGTSLCRFYKDMFLLQF